MRNLKAPPSEETLFNLEAYAWWHRQLSPPALRALQNGWQGLFHSTILALLQQPAEALGRHFHEVLGRPTKELYALSGLLLIAEFKNWTIDAAAEAWSFDASLQYALHLPRDGQYLCPRTLDTYRRLLREDDSTQEIFALVTDHLVKALELNIRRQRLDSTHVLSQMAKLTRTQLLAVTLRRFLHALRRREETAWQSLPAELRERYEPAETRLFGFGTRQPQPREEVLRQVAEDLALVITRFAEDAFWSQHAAYRALGRIFREHCEVQEGRTVVRPQSRDEEGGSVGCLQNPSDPEAGYSGHKGAGYQVQLAQTLPPRDAQEQREGPGLITACVPQSASVRDNVALAEVVAQQQKNGLAPEDLLLDTTYGSDSNVQACALQGITLWSPVGGVAPKAGAAAVHRASCAEQELKARLQARRAEQETPEWQSTYGLRSGIEGLHHALDVVTGMKHLRVRGGRAVKMAVTLKVTGWNILAAAKILNYRRRQGAKKAQAAPVERSSSRVESAERTSGVRLSLRARFSPAKMTTVRSLPPTRLLEAHYD